jgi:putative drug exporter of the RND superfamily
MTAPDPPSAATGPAARAIPQEASQAPPPGRRNGPPILRAVLLVLLVGVWLGIAAVGGPAIGSLSSVQSNDQKTFLPPNAESVKAAEAAAAFTPVQALPAFVVFATTTGQPATPDQLASWAKTATLLPPTVVDPARPDLGTVGDYLLPDQPAPVPSQDGQAGLLIVQLDQAKATKPGADGEAPLGAVVTAIRGVAAAQAAGGTSHVTGPAGIVADLVTAFAGIDGILLVVAVLAVLVILILVYRAVALPFLVLISAVSALALGGFVVYHLAKAGHLTLSGQSQGILFILVVGAATDYGLLLVSRYREELHHQASTWQAMRRAWRACLAPIAASAGTVIIGLLCLTLSELNSNKSLGPVGAIGIAAAFLAGMTLLPVLLLLGRWVFWPRVPHLDPTVDPAGAAAAGVAVPQSPSGEVGGVATVATGESAARGLWAAVARFVGRHPRRIWVVTAILLGVACCFVPTLHASGTRQTDVFLDRVDSVAGQDVLAQHFPGGAGSPAVIIAPQADAAKVAAAAKVDGVVAVVPLTAQGPVPGGVPVVVNGQIQLQAELADLPDSDQAKDTVSAMRDAVHAVSPSALVGGQTAIQIDSRAAARHDLRLIIPLILIAVFLVLILLLRALIAPLVLIAATVLSFGAALGVSALVFNHVFGFPGADPGVPLYAFVFLVALGIDYSIFLMTRAREETGRHGPRDGVLRALRVTGGVITSAGVVLATTFAALGVIPILFLAQIAFIVAFGVLLDTLVVRSLLVPAVSVELGRLTWWPGRLSRSPESSVRQGPAGR